MRKPKPIVNRARPGEAVAALARLMAVETDDCVLWPHGTNGKGYGQIAVNGVSKSVHVLVCERTHGPRPGGMQVGHRCGIRPCMNPRHLRWVTPEGNARDLQTHRWVRGERAVARVAEADARIAEFDRWLSTRSAA